MRILAGWVLASILLVAGLAGGCEALVKTPSAIEAEPPREPGARREVAELLRNVAWFEALPEERQRQVLHHQQLAFERSPTPWERLYLAALLSVPGSAFQDEERAARLLADYPRGESGPVEEPLGIYARAKLSALRGRLALRREIAELRAELAQRASEAEERRREVAELKAEIAELRKQLEELKEIETKMNRRDRGM